MAKFTLTPAIFEAEYSSDPAGGNDLFCSLQTDGGRYGGLLYQEDSQITFCIGGKDVKIWVADIEEMTLGTVTHFKGDTFSTNAELVALLKVYSTSLMVLS